jgi:hypothetical protein
MEAVDVDAVIEIDDEEQPKPEAPRERPSTPPPEPSEPSGKVLALTRLLDLETQMEYAFAKHLQLVRRQKLLRLQYKALENFPVGIDAIKDDLAILKAKHDEEKSLYEDGVE